MLVPRIAPPTGLQRADPVVGLVILRITWQGWVTISRTEPGEML